MFTSPSAPYRHLLNLVSTQCWRMCSANVLSGESLSTFNILNFIWFCFTHTHARVRTNGCKMSLSPYSGKRHWHTEEYFPSSTLDTLTDAQILLLWIIHVYYLFGHSETITPVSSYKRYHAGYWWWVQSLLGALENGILCLTLRIKNNSNKEMVNNLYCSRLPV